MTKISRYIGIILCIVLTSLFCMQTVAQLSDRYIQTVETYAEGNSPFFIHNQPQEKNSEILRDIQRSADETHSLIIRYDPLNSTNSAGLRLGLYGDAIHKDYSLTFLGNTLLSAQQIEKLYHAPANASIGVDKAQADVLNAVPEIYGMARFSAVKLSDMVDTSHTVNGTYGIVSDNPKAFITKLSQYSGISPEKLQTRLAGISFEPMLLTRYVLVFLIVSWILLVFVLSVGVFQKLPQLGVVSLLGWSRKEYALELMFPIVIAGVCSIPFAAYLLHLFLAGFTFTTPVLVLLVRFSAMSITLIVIACAIASISIFTTLPIDAIRQRFNHKLLAALIVIFYILANAGSVLALYSFDGPYFEMQTNAEIQQRWKNVENLYILRSQQNGNDFLAISGHSEEVEKDWYNWYRSIEGREGVYLINTMYYSPLLLQQYKEDKTYTQVPDQPFWSMTASPNYLKRIGLSVPQKAISDAKSGQRIYLIPSQWSASRKAITLKMLTESDQQEGKTIITNAYSRNPQSRVIEYTAPSPLFVWNTQRGVQSTSRDVVIKLTTSENMTSFEDESLAAPGLENSYFKLDSTAYRQFANQKYFAGYHLDDNRPEFLTVANFIAGIQKSLKETLILFGAIIAFIFFIEVIMLFGLIRLFVQLRSRQIAVKRLLGYSLTSIYMLPMLCVLITCTLSLIASIILRSTSAVVMLSILTLVQILICLWQAQRSAHDQVNTIIKSE